MTDNDQQEQWMTHGLATGETAVMLKRELPNPLIVPAFLIVARCSVKSDADQIVSDHNARVVYEQALRDVTKTLMSDEFNRELALRLRLTPNSIGVNRLVRAVVGAMAALGGGKEKTDG